MSNRAAEDRERAAKKKLQGFLTEMLRVGCVKGFKYFSMYMRGREELICTVLNEPLTPRSASPSAMGAGERRFSFGNSFTSSDMPFDQKDLMMSSGTQRRLSGLGYMDVGLPPASPSEREITPMTDDRTVFLVAGYAKYVCPYVWVRNNHERLVRRKEGESTTSAAISKDSPLKLKSTSHWNDKSIRIWDILAELVKLCTLPSPRNPFAVDLEYFASLPLTERVLASSAMAHFLQCVLIYAGDKSYSGLVADDLREITKHHFADFQTHLLQQATQPEKEQQQASNTETQQYGYQQQQGNTYASSATATAAASPVQYSGYSSGRSKLTQRVVAPY